jgi:hypothetical protein
VPANRKVGTEQASGAFAIGEINISGKAAKLRGILRTLIA